MANAVTLTELITRVRSMANLEGDSADDFVTDTEITQWINAAIRELYDKLIHARGEDYYGTYYEQDILPGVGTYYVCGAPAVGETPGEAQLYYRMLEVIVADSTSAVRIPRYQSGEYAEQLGQALAARATCRGELKWKPIKDDRIMLMPYPGASDWHLRCHYIPTFVDLSSGSDSFDGINGWEEWAVLTAAIKCMAKGEEDPSALLALRGDVDARIARMADRDDSEPRRVADTNPDRLYFAPFRYRRHCY